MKLTATYQPGASPVQSGGNGGRRPAANAASSSVVLTEAPSTERTADEGLESSSPSPRRLKCQARCSVDPKVCEHAASLVP